MEYRISDIKTLLDKADKAEANLGQWRWEAAEGIVQQLDAGISSRELATQVARDKSLVNFYARVWREREEHGFEDFQTAYRWVQANPKNPRPKDEPTQPVNEVRPPPSRTQEVSENPGRTTEEYKADRALVEEQLQPLRDAINAIPGSFALPCFVGTLEEALDMLEEADPNYITREDLQAAYDQLAKLSQRLMELELALSEELT